MLLENPHGELDWIEDHGFCPNCGANWDAGIIPSSYTQNGQYGDRTHYSYLVGIEDPLKYDGVSIWACPFCGKRWCRWCGKVLAEGEVHEPYHNSIIHSHA